tara:strand:+ start:185 stop:910 length:726 start_codon:yes stop_codon:yes gene_type:complete
MKNYFFILLLMVSLNGFSQKITGKVTYTISMEAFSEKKLDSIIKSTSNNKKANIFLKEMFKNADDVKASLAFTNKESIYIIEDNLQNDGKSKLNLNRILAGASDIYYKNIELEENYRESSSLGELMLIEIESKKWQITQESKTIGNYLCYKAIDINSRNTKMKPIAWFTPLIPISFGPKEYSGLPGLILEVEMFNSKIVATKIVLNPNEEIIIEKPSKGKRITIEEYDDFIKKFEKSRKRF